MKFGARIITFLVLASFLPASIVSAAPLVWCVAEGDHAAIEIALIKHAHTGVDRQHVHHAVSETSHRGTADDHQQPCVDYDVDGAAIAAAKPDPQGAAVAGIHEPYDRTVVMADRARLAARAVVRPPPDIDRPPAALTAWQTVKLRL